MKWFVGICAVVLAVEGVWIVHSALALRRERTSRFVYEQQGDVAANRPYSRDDFDSDYAAAAEFVAPPGQVVFERGPAATEDTDIVAVPDQFLASPAWARSAPACWQRLSGGLRQTVSPHVPIVYLHAIGPAEASRRLVATELDFSPITTDGESLLLRVTTLTPRFRRRGTAVSQCRLPASLVRLYAGESDPADATHFYARFDYKPIDGSAVQNDGRIDGWLEPDGRARLVVTPQDSSAMPTGQPATQPSGR